MLSVYAEPEMTKQQKPCYRPCVQHMSLEHVAVQPFCLLSILVLHQAAERNSHPQVRLRCTAITRLATDGSSPHILFLILLVDRDALSVGLQLVLYDLAISTMLHTEGVVQHASDVVVTDWGGEISRQVTQRPESESSLGRRIE